MDGHHGEQHSGEQHGDGQHEQGPHDSGHGDERATPMRRLGRGLNALLGGDQEESHGPTAADAPAEAGTSDIGAIHVELIERNPYQPRRDFDEEGLAELADSLKRLGLLQPILVRPHNGSYQLIAGERRLIAAKRIGMETIPCRVLEYEDRQVCEVALEENLKRKDLSVLEKAQAFKDYLDRFNSTVEELAGRLGMSRPAVSNYVRLLELPEPVKQAVRTEKVSPGAARAMLSLPEADQIALCERVAKEGMTVRAVEAQVRELAGRAAIIPFPAPEGEQPATGNGAATPKAGDPNRTNHIISIAEQLRDVLGAKVEIKLKGKEAGRIVIDFSSNDEFERIVTHLRSAA